jgi:hypothetical protein
MQGGDRRMTRTELAAEAWRAWVKDKPFQSEDTAKGFIEGFNLCLLGKIKIEGGDKGELISENFSLQDRITALEKKNAELKDCLTVGSAWNKHLNAQNKALEEDRDKYRTMVFDEEANHRSVCESLTNTHRHIREQLTEAKNHIHRLLVLLIEGKQSYAVIDEAKAFLEDL